MSQELRVRVAHQGGMHFVASTVDHVVSLDYPLRPGETAGPTPLEMLLASLAACAGSTVAVLLGRVRAPLVALEVEARGMRREEHPTVLTEIALEFIVQGEGLDPEMLARAVRIAEEQLCPVWAMLKPGTVISSSFRVAEG